jgi:hypothetical protein
MLTLDGLRRAWSRPEGALEKNEVQRREKNTLLQEKKGNWIRILHSYTPKIYLQGTYSHFQKVTFEIQRSIRYDQP